MTYALTVSWVLKSRISGNDFVFDITSQHFQDIYFLV